MRHPLVPPLLVVLALLGYAVVGAVAVQAAHPVPVSGTVTDDAGRPVADAAVVLEPADGDLLAEATDGDRAVHESVLKLAESGSDGLVVVRTDEDGEFTASVQEGHYRIVAVTRERISPIREVDANGGATVDLTVDRHQVLELDAGSDGPVAPGNETTVTVRVQNPDDEAVRSLSVTVGDLPTGWTLTGVDTDGSYDADARRLTWERVPPGENATVTLHVEVPEGAERGHHDVPLEADSDSHYVEDFHAGMVVVRPANATPTPTAQPGELGETESPSPSPIGHTDTPGSHGDRPLPVPGFGVTAGLGALAVALVLAVHRS